MNEAKHKRNSLPEELRKKTTTIDLQKKETPFVKIYTQNGLPYLQLMNPVDSLKCLFCGYIEA